MAKKSMIIKCARKQKFSTREYNRCQICGRPRGYLRKKKKRNNGEYSLAYIGRVNC